MTMSTRDFILGLLAASAVWGYIHLQSQIGGIVTALQQAQQRTQQQQRLAEQP